MREIETIIRQASLSDKDAIWDFLKIAYSESVKYKIPDRWSWEFTANPLINKTERKIPVFIAIKKDKIVGQLCAILNQIKIGNEIYSSVAGCDLIVLPDHRKEGLAHKLIESVSEHYKIYLAISYAETTKRIYDRMKPIRLGEIPTYFRFQKMTSESVFYFFMLKTAKHLWLQNITRFGCRFGADKFISIIINIFIKLRDIFKGNSKKLIKSNIEEIKCFDEKIDDLWNRINKKFNVIIKRDKQFLNWRFSDCPQLDYRKFISSRNGIVTGYIVLRKPSNQEVNIGIISDLFVDPDDHETLKDLINFSIHYFGKTVLIIECPTTQKEYQTVLSKLGFFKTKKNMPILFCENVMLKTKLEDWKNNWFLTKADEDWDQMRPLVKGF